MNPAVGIANPEAIINAAVAANAAAQSAQQAFVVSMIILVAIILTTVMMVTIAVNFVKLEKNTNSMKDALVDATRKLALIEGRVLGRAEQLEEDEDDKQKEAT